MNAIKFIFLISSIYFFNLSTYCQSTNVDDQELRKIKKIKNYISWITHYGYQKKFDSAYYYAKKASQLSKGINDIELQASIIHNNAKVLYWQAKTTEAKKLIKQNLKNTKLVDSIRIRAFWLLGRILKYEENYSDALNQFVKIEKMVRMSDILTHRDSNTIFKINMEIGFIHEKAKNIDKAHNYYDNAMLYSGNNPEYKNIIAYSKATLYNETKGIKESIKYSLEGIEISTKNNFEIYLPTFYLFISNAYLELKKGDSAIYYGKKGLFDNNHCRRELLFNNIGKGYVLLNDYNKSISYFKKALDHASEKQSLEIHKNMRDAFILMKNYKKAIFHNKKYLSLKNNIDSLQIRQQLLEITEKYESEKNKLEIEMLQSENSHNDFVIKKKNNQIILISSTLLSSLALLLFIVFSYNKQKKHKNLLFDKNRLLAQKLKNSEDSLVQRYQIKNDKKKSESLSIDTVQKEKIHAFLVEAIQEEFYLDKNISLSKLAKQANTNTTYLSKVINDDYKKSFVLFINELRVSYTLKKLEVLPNYRNLTIENIADKAGFSSSPAFYNAFKNFTGLTPSYYIKKKLLQGNS